MSSNRSRPTSTSRPRPTPHTTRSGSTRRPGRPARCTIRTWVAYFTSRGACLGPNVDGHLVASAFGVFKRPMVVAAVADGWRRADQPTVLAARERGGVSSLRRLLGDEPEGLGWATEALQRMVDAAPGGGARPVLRVAVARLPRPSDGCVPPRGRPRARAPRRQPHRRAWIGADLDVCEVGVLTDVSRRQPLKSWVRSRGWTEDELDAACDRLRSRGLLDNDELTDAGRGLSRGNRRRDGSDGESPRCRSWIGCAAVVRSAGPVVRPDRRRRRIPGTRQLADLTVRESQPTNQISAFSPGTTPSRSPGAAAHLRRERPRRCSSRRPSRSTRGRSAGRGWRPACRRRGRCPWRRRRESGR